MKYNFNRTFDGVKLSDKKQEEIKSELSSRLLERQKENLFMNEKTHSFKKYRVLVVAVIAVLALPLVGFAYGNQIIKLLGGGNIEQGRNENGEDFISTDTGFVSDPFRIKDNQIYFILNGLDTNITNQCSESSYFKYETTNEDGYRNVVIIGGTADNIGMAEFVWDENGEFKGSNASYNTEEEPQWLKSATKELLNE